MPSKPPPPLTLLSKPSGSDPLVLVVDDIDEYRRHLARMVRLDLGFEVIEASSGHEAIRLCEQRVPDLVISDERMPFMNGAELLAEIGRRWPETRRILLSAYTTGDMVVGLGYAVLDKTLSHWVIRDEIRRYARGT